MRLDVALVEWGFEPSRSKAQASIKEKLVFVDGRCVTKSSYGVASPDQIEMKGTACPFVGRGGLKLEHAIEQFDIDLTGMTCVDVGASTGGFTECMIKHGARKVFSIDVGTGQLDVSLRDDPRVTSMEGIDIREVSTETLGGFVDFAATDVSFISLDKILLPMADLMRDGSLAVCLIKPQFEAGRCALDKHGIVRDPLVHIDVVEKVLREAKQIGFSVVGLGFSPIMGGDGNIEYLVCMKKESCSTDKYFDVPEIVKSAHHALKANG